MRRLVWTFVPLLLLTACGASSPAQTAKDNNATACDSYRGHMHNMGSVFGDLSKGTIAVADALAPIRKAQKDLANDALVANGQLATGLQALSDDLGRMRVEMSTSGTTPDSVTKPVLADFDPIDAACKALGH
jgi:hypothetical protein